MEIERKFLVTSEDWRTPDPIRIAQGYLNRSKDRTVRVRIAGPLGFITVKGPTTSASRSEFEYEIPLTDAQEMLALCEGPIVEKIRHLVNHQGLLWEIDEFLGQNAGLVVAEVELESEDQDVPIPPWVGMEVTGDPRYFNSRLSEHPFSVWKA